MIKKILMGIRGSLLFGGGFMALLKGSGDLAQVIFEKPQTKKVSTPSTEVTVEHVTPTPVHKPPVQPATVKKPQPNQPKPQAQKQTNGGANSQQQNK